MALVNGNKKSLHSAKTDEGAIGVRARTISATKSEVKFDLNLSANVLFYLRHATA